MNISAGIQQNLASLKQAINISNMQKAMNQDAQSVDNLMKSMKDANKVSHPYKGNNLDIKG